MWKLPFMDNQFFEYFLELTETLSFTKAADKLYKSESVLSRQILKLENNLGVKLFDRNKKKITLTPAGEAFLCGLKSISKNYIALVEELKAIQSGFSGVIKFAALSGVIPHRNMLKVLGEFEECHPDIHIDFRTYHLGELRNLMLEHQIDFIYGATDDFSDNMTFSNEVICYAKKSIVVPKSHPRAKAAICDLKVADFKDDTFIFSTHQDLAIRAFTTICEKFGFLPKCTLVADESMILLSVEMQRGITLLDETHMFKGNEDLILLSIPELGYTELGIIHDKTNQKACKMLFLDYIKQKTKIESTNDGVLPNGIFPSIILP